MLEMGGKRELLRRFASQPHSQISSVFRSWSSRTQAQVDSSIIGFRSLPTPRPRPAPLIPLRSLVRTFAIAPSPVIQILHLLLVVPSPLDSPLLAPSFDPRGLVSLSSSESHSDASKSGREALEKKKELGNVRRTVLEKCKLLNGAYPGPGGDVLALAKVTVFERARDFEDAEVAE